jgi:hypothetical protein
MNADQATTSADKPAIYRIRVEGQLGPQWADWFEGMTITLEAGDTLLCGIMSDQARLHGVLKKVRDLALPLVSVMRVPSSETQHTQGDF